jgi:hypothetical protein
MLVKTLLGSLAAKLAMGVGVAAAAVTAVGATGALPAPAQHAVASVVAATTPFVLPDPSTTTANTTRDKADAEADDDVSTVTGAPGTPTSADDPAGHERAENHGACVSAAAHDKSGTDSHGKTVSSVARSDCGKPTPSSTVPSTSSTTSSTSTSVAGAARTSNSGPGSVNNGSLNSGTANDKSKGSDDTEKGSGSGSGSGKGSSGSSGRD